MKALLFILITLLIQSCGSSKYKMGSDNAYINTSKYQKRKELKKSFFKKEANSFTEKQIKTLLSSKVNLRKPLKVAVVKLGNKNNSWYNSPNSFSGGSMNVSEKNEKAIKGILKRSKYIKDISFIPSFMMPEENTIRNLRDTAALFQADLILIIQSSSIMEFDTNLLANNEAKATASIEAIMVDVLTGVVPYTALTKGTHHTKRTYGKDKDFSNEELKRRTAISAEENAFSKLAEDVGVYFN